MATGNFLKKRERTNYERDQSGIGEGEKDPTERKEYKGCQTGDSAPISIGKKSEKKEGGAFHS